MASHQTNLPARSDTVKSSEGYVTDEEAIPEVAPRDTAGLLIERLRAWKHCCADIESYVKATEKLLKEHSKNYSKLLKSVNEPLREQWHFDQALGGVAGLFENMRTNTQAISNSYLDTSKSLDTQVLPILERLHKEIKEKSKELESGAGKSAKIVEAAEFETQKRIDLLGHSTSSYDSVGGKIDASSDPYVVGRGIHHMLNKQIAEENNSRDDLIAVQNNFQEFEAHIVAHIQQAFGQLLLLMGGRAEKEKAIYSDITHNAQSIPPDFEWSKFLQRSGDMLIKPDAPLRDIAHVTWPNQHHASTKPLIAGNLERKSRGVGALTGYKTGYYVVTPAKFLHQFESDDDFKHDPSPELSLFLPDCTVGSVSGEKFNVKGKDLSKGKIGSAFAMSHEIAFKASSAGEAQRWREIIASVATGTNDLPVDSAVTSPISPSADDRLPPPNTDVPARQVIDEKGAGGHPVAAAHPTAAHPVAAHPAAAESTAAQPVTTHSVAADPVAAHPTAAQTTGSTMPGQTSGVVEHAVATPAAPTSATTASPGAEVLGKETHAA